MEKVIQPTTLRMAAVDLDGTLLGPDRSISKENLAALESLAQSGVEVVLASGRHYDSMLPYAEQLPMINWIVSTQGAEVSSKDRSQILHRDYLKPSEVEALAHLCAARGLSDVSYTPERILTCSSPNRGLDRYARLSGRTPVHVTLDELLKQNVHKMVWMGTTQQVAALKEDSDLRALGLQTVQTFEDIYEVMPQTTTKAGGLAVLTQHLGIAPSQVAVFGDGDNDIPMFRWASKSFCMPHGWPGAQQSATHVIPAASEETALAAAIAKCRELYLPVPA